MRPLSCIFLVATFVPLLVAPVHAAQWVRTYGGTGDYRASSAHQTADGGFVVAGRARLSGPNDYAAWVLKVDAGGDVTWQRAFGGPPYDARHVQPAVDGGYFLVGWEPVSTLSGSLHITDVTKLDASGNVVWTRSYSTINPLSAQRTADGGFLVAGYQRGVGGIIGFSDDATVLRFDANGDLAWAAAYGGSRDDRANSAQPTPDGGYIVAGATSSFGAGGTDAWVLKLDAAGDVVWQKAFGGPAYDSADAVRPMADGGYVIAGRTESFGAGVDDLWVMKLDGVGNVAWQRTYGGANRDAGASVLTASDGGYVVVGWTESFGVGGADAWILKLDAQGDVVWQRTYGGAGNDFANSVEPTADGGYIVAGSTFSSGAGDAEQGWLLKLDANGAVAGCAAMGSSSAIPVNGGAIAVVTTAVRDPSSERGVETTVRTRDTGAASTRQCQDPSPASRLPAIEYYHHAFDHYFVTASAQEAAALDAGRFPGWERTGGSFQVYGLDPAASGVCRFWSSQTFAPKSSHFYTPYTAECAYLQQQSIWQYEGNVFALALPSGPAGQGTCAAPTRPLYRAYNNGQGGAPNHRYTTDPAVLDAMIAQGWVMEGEAATRVFACVPAP